MSRKSVGIITFHFSKNYGSALQCYALYRTLLIHGYKAEVVDYCPSYHTMSYNTYYSFSDFYENKENNRFLYIVLRMLKWNAIGFFKVCKKSKNKKFSNFISRNIKLTKQYKYVKDIDNSLDIYISGSDQIWNYQTVKDKEYGGTYDKAYFLAFAGNKKKIAYAVSAQHGDIRTDLDQDVLPLIKDYDYIFTRETALEDTLHQMGRLDATTVLDPTLLLEKTYYENIEAKLPYTKKNYILVYNLPGENSALLEAVAEKVSERTGYRIIDISPSPYADLNSRKIKSCGPAEFLAYIHNAEYILTDSFHCIAFAIIYQKNFNCVLRERTDERIKYILNLCGLNGKLIESIDNRIDLEQIDFSTVEECIEPERQKSINLLLKALES